MKKKNLMRLLSLGLTAVMAFSCLTGCGKSESTGSESESSASAQVESKTDAAEQTGDAAEEESSTKVTFPLEESVKMSVFVQIRPNVDNFEDNAMTKWLEEQTNIEFEFVVAEAAEVDTKLNLLLSTGEYPDLIMGMNVNSSLQSMYGKEGVFIPLNDYIEDTTYIKQMFEEYPQVLDSLTMEDGNVYKIPMVNDALHLQSNHKMFINQVWLDNLGLKMPTTTEEFREVLRAFKEDDPNGNGIADEIPMAGSPKGWNASVENFLMDAFVYDPGVQSGAKRLFVQDGQVVASYTQDAYKEGLKYIQSLFDEGLIARDSFTMDGQGLKNLAYSSDDVVLGCFPGGSQSTAYTVTDPQVAEYTALEPLMGPDGVQTAFYNPYACIGASGMCITDKCEYPEIAMALADLLCSPEGTMWNHSGEKGVDWDWLPEDTDMVGINGEKARYWAKTMPSDRMNAYWNQNGPDYLSSDLRLSQAVDPENPTNEVFLYEMTVNRYLPHCPDISEILPPLVFNQETQTEISTLAATIDPYVDEMVAAFCLGEDIDANWDTFLKTLEDMGLSKLLGYYQEGLDKYNSK